MGVNLGDVIVEGGDIFGDGVNVAARLEGIAPIGGITVSQSVCDHVGNRSGLTFEDMGERRLKNIERPIRVYSISIDTLSQSPDRASTPAEEKPSIAVLPFNNMSGDPEQEYFSDGITEDIITDLSKVSALFVVARNTAFTYKGKPMKVREVAQELGVSFILEGSVRKAGSRVRVNGQLIDGKNGGHVWADRYDRDLTDIFAIQDEITHADCGTAKGQAAAAGKEVHRAGADRQRRSLHFLSPRPPIYAAALEDRTTNWRAGCSPTRLNWTRSMHAAYAGIADCDSFLFLHYHLEACDRRLFWPPLRRRWVWTTNSPKPMLREGSRCHLGNDTRKRRRNSNGQSRWTQIPSRRIIFTAVPASRRGNWNRQPRFLSRSAENKPDDYQSLCLLIQAYRSLGRCRDSERAAHSGIERAENELTLHPENARPAYLGAAAARVALGDKDRAREWASRALSIDPDDVLDAVQCRLRLFSPGRYRAGFRFAGTFASQRRSRVETRMDQTRF